MKRMVKSIFYCLLMLGSVISYADMELSAPDGKRVLLKDNMTWQYLEQLSAHESQDRYANLSVASVDEKSSSCRIGLRMRNDLADEISSIVLRFSAYIEGGILYDTVSKGFQRLKPTNEQYQEIAFIGLQCSNIKSIRVHGGDRCSTGELTKFSAEKGKCLDRVYVEASDKITIYKHYSDDVIPVNSADDPKQPESREME